MKGKIEKKSMRVLKFRYHSNVHATKGTTMNETRQRRQSLIMIDYECRGKERSVFGIQEADTQIAHGEYWRTTQCPKPDGDKDV